jgi:hypothetical protein
VKPSERRCKPIVPLGNEFPQSRNVRTHDQIARLFEAIPIRVVDLGPKSADDDDS